LNPSKGIPCRVWLELPAIHASDFGDRECGL
jgi:hypothetical protein